MRNLLIILPLALVAAPAAAQGQPPAPSSPQAIQIPPELSDPRVADRLADMMQVLSKAFLELPAGEIQAAAEGRKPTEHDKGVTVRELGRRDDPNFERNLERQIAESKPMMRAGMKALVEALPAMMGGLMEAGKAMERAAANMPRPGYPKR